MGKKNLMSIIGIVVIIASIVFLVVSYVTTQDYVEITAKVISMEYDPSATTDDDGVTQDYDVTFEYEVDGKTYTATYDCNESDYSIGDEVKLNYDPDKPQDTSLGKMSLPVLIGISAAALVVGVIVIIKARRG
ncbi:MAG: DUF3592 domain-containing protein [Ruminococcus sp.]|nr:DUF3592 domain-containing protein [Ruminococcus sp.]